MARRRFSDLERVYTALKLGKVDPSTLPQNLDFVKYAKWREGNGEERKIIRPDLKGEVEVGVNAFGYPFGDAKGKIKISISGRSNAFLNGFSPNAKFGVINTALETYLKVSSFVPAKARIATIVPAKDGKSRITGRKYKTRSGTAYTVPMGRTEGLKQYQEKINDILSDPVFVGSNATHTVSFDPEEFRRD